jgi:hypothetical protein
MCLGLLGAIVVLRKVMLQSRHADRFNLKLLRAQKRKFHFQKAPLRRFERLLKGDDIDH